MWTNQSRPPDLSRQPGRLSSLGAAFLFIWELVKVVIMSLAIILPIRYFLVQPFYVKGASMEPNFLEHDYLLVDELSFRLRPPVRGEVVVFHYPRQRSEFFIKRVIGLPDEHLVIRGGRVTVGRDDEPLQPLDESYLRSGVVTTGSIDVTLGRGEYYLLGDNREYSLDSRSFGAVAKSDFIGRAWIRGWPFSRWAWFSVPDNASSTP